MAMTRKWLEMLVIWNTYLLSEHDMRKCFNLDDITDIKVTALEAFFLLFYLSTAMERGVETSSIRWKLDFNFSVLRKYCNNGLKAQTHTRLPIAIFFGIFHPFFYVNFTETNVCETIEVNNIISTNSIVVNWIFCKMYTHTHDVPICKCIDAYHIWVVMHKSIYVYETWFVHANSVFRRQNWIFSGATHSKRRFMHVTPIISIEFLSAFQIMLFCGYKFLRGFYPKPKKYF